MTSHAPVTRAEVGGTLWEDKGAMPRASGGVPGAPKPWRLPLAIAAISHKTEKKEQAHVTVSSSQAVVRRVRMRHRCQSRGEGRSVPSCLIGRGPQGAERLF